MSETELQCRQLQEKQTEIEALKEKVASQRYLRKSLKAKGNLSG